MKKGSWRGTGPPGERGGEREVGEGNVTCGTHVMGLIKFDR